MTSPVVVQQKVPNTHMHSRQKFCTGIDLIFTNQTSEPSPLNQGGWSLDRKWLHCVNNITCWVISLQGQVNISSASFS